MLIVEHAPTYLATQGLRYENILGQTQRIFPAYAEEDDLIFLHPLDRYNLPKRVWDDSLKINLDFPATQRLDPYQNNVVQMGAAQAFFPIDGVFQPTFISYATRQDAEIKGPVYQIGDPSIPLFRGFILSVPARKDIPLSQQYIAEWDGKEWDFAGSRKGPDGTLRARCGDFGQFGIMRDSTPPNLRAITFSNGGRIRPGTRLILKYKDEGSGISSGSISGELGGEFVPFEYDWKRDRIIGYLDRIELPKGKHTLKVRIRDRVGNETVESYELVW